MNLKNKGFQIPEKVYFDTESLTDTYGKLYAEAFERGFGATIGNSIRRVLLASIEGSAVSSIKIPGVSHEFSSVSGVKEDVVDIVLNVKQLRLKLHSSTPKVLTINVKGPKDVKGKDIKAGSQVDILNPDIHIATVGKNVNFKMELTVEKGRGYVSAEGNKKEDQAVEVIAVDSIFTPIKKVNFWVESARVGRSTDYDRLIMEIWTDGSITPKHALTQASNILGDYVSIFSLEAEPVEEEKIVEVEAEEDPEDPVIENENLHKNVDELELSVRSSNCLKNANIRTIFDLVQRTEHQMLRTKNFGRKSLNEIKEILNSMELHFNMKIESMDEMSDTGDGSEA